jgi:DNA-binding CsgD family transcriptional regulator
MLYKTIQAYLELLTYNHQQRDILYKICKPLFDHLPISHFFYGRYYIDGRYFMLGDHNKAIELYYHHNLSHPDQIFLEDFATVPYQGMHKFIWPSDSQYLPQSLELLNEMNIGNGLNITINKGDFLETFIFATHPENTQIQNLYLNSFHLLQRFIDFFEERGSSLITLEGIKNLPYSTLYESKLNKNELDYSEQRKTEKFIDQTKLSKHHISVQGSELKLSNREFDCLAYLSKGKSVKETASLLNLSPYTVTSYLEHIKLKLGVFSKSKMIDIFLASCPHAKRNEQ